MANVKAIAIRVGKCLLVASLIWLLLPACNVMMPPEAHVILSNEEGLPVVGATALSPMAQYAPHRVSNGRGNLALPSGQVVVLADGYESKYVEVEKGDVKRLTMQRETSEITEAEKSRQAWDLLLDGRGLPPRGEAITDSPTP